MKKSVLLNLLTILAASFANAQQGFLSHTSDLGTAKFNMIELPSGNFMVGMAHGSGVSIMNASGHPLHTRHFAIDTLLGLQSIKYADANRHVFVATYRKDTCPTSQWGVNYPAWGVMDTLGNISLAQYYVFNEPYCSNYAGDAHVTSGGDVVLWGFDRQFFFLRANAVGELMWAKRYSTSIHGGFRFIKELPNGDLLAGINMDTAGVAVARLDAAGNFIWLKSYFRPRGMVTDALVESDDAFIITGYTDSIASPAFLNPLPPSYRPKLFMMKLDGSGDVQWCKGYDSDPYRWYTRTGTRIDRHHDGNYILLGNIGVANYHVGYRPLLMKINQNGDTLWTRSAGRDGQVYDIINMTVCSDGGILYNGQSLTSSPDMFIFKADSLGYLPCHNRWHQVVVSDLFPSDSSFTLASIDGATAYPAFINVATHPAALTTDGCLVSTNWSEGRSGMRIRPNPTTGRITVEFHDPLMAESWYSLYDAMGKLLYQRPWPAGKRTEELDLTRFGSGTYVIRFTSPEGSCYERVVVE